MFKKNFLTVTILAFIFIIALIATVLGGFVLEGYASWGKKQSELPPSDYPRLSQNLQSQLNGAFAPEFPFNFDTAVNPFRDLSGVSIAAQQREQAAAGAGEMIAKNYLAGGQIQPPGIPLGVQPVTKKAVTPSSAIDGVDPKRLLAERERAIRQGQQSRDLSEIYSIEDVRPIGVVGSGDRNRVLLYSPVTKQTFSVMKGTRFRDGAIDSFNSEGAVFRRLNGTTVANRWMRNSEKTPLEPDPEAPVLRVEPRRTQRASNAPLRN